MQHAVANLMFVKKPEEQTEKMREAVALSGTRSWGRVFATDIRWPDVGVYLFAHRFYPRWNQNLRPFLLLGTWGSIFDTSRTTTLFPWTSRGSGLELMTQSQARITRRQSLSKLREWSLPGF